MKEFTQRLSINTCYNKWLFERYLVIEEKIARVIGKWVN